MQNQILKYQINSNSIDQFILINPTKQQLAFFPKEESQMFQGRTYDYVSTNSEKNTENTDTRAFMERSKQMGIVDLSEINVSSTPTNLADYDYSLHQINSSHTPTDYIGSVIYHIPTTLNQDFVDFFFINLDNELVNLYEDSDTNPRFLFLQSGVLKLRVPRNRFNTVLTNPQEILDNEGSNIIPNYGTYHVLIAPKYFDTTVLDIIPHNHITWENMPNNTDDETTSVANILPINKRRTIVECNKDNFLETVWSFENNPKQSGRLYGSVVEVWNSTKTILKQTKIITENLFNLDVSGNVQLVMQPDIVGYDTEDQVLSVGDVLRIYPRETYFNQILIELNYVNINSQIENLISFMVNDSVRDTQNGIVEVYDENGVNIDSSGNFNGTVLQRYQLAQIDKYQIRKKIK